MALKMKKVWLAVVLVVFLVSSMSLAYAHEGSNYDKYLTGEYWKQQALTEIIPFWMPTIDKVDGGFFTFLDNYGDILPVPLKYPRMVSRMIYGFSAAYLLSGNEDYLAYAKHGLDYLQKYGWDPQYGGWYTELYNNTPTIPTKDLFDETYGNLGPIFYYYTTGAPQALDLVEKTHRLIRQKAWDPQFQGYFGIVNNDWSVSQTYKSFNSEIDTASAYLLYYYLNTKDPNLLCDLKDIGNLAINRMYDPKTGYIRENFAQNWSYIDSNLGSADLIDIGHNLKTAWVLLRLYQLTGERQYLGYAQKIGTKMMETAWDQENFGWYFIKSVNYPPKTDYQKQKCWWTQSEGNFMLLNLFNLTHKELYLDYFKKSAYFWDTNIVDHTFKEVYSYTSRDGTVKNFLKADMYKSAYHSMENALMNYLYLQLYVHHDTAELYFNLSAATEGVRHYVKIIEDPDVIIKQVELNGRPWDKFDAKAGYVTLPQGEGLKVKVVFGVSSSQ